ncbi:MAG TPA: recombinase family protein [Gemmataceae bacterium]|nr:recombinase family protein [Gemmataceae bacterium]
MSDALGYIRVSSEEQADSGLGLEAQRQRIAAYCAMKGLLLAEVFEDPGISGGKPLATRPAGSQLLAVAKKSKAIVVVAKLDRLFRSVADAASVIAEFDKKGIPLVAIAEAFERSAMSVKRLRGERISGHAPYGRDFGRGGRPVRNAREHKIIARVRRLRAEGLSYRGIATRLDAEGVRPKRGRQWVHTTVKSVLMRNAG